MKLFISTILFILLSVVVGVFGLQDCSSKLLPYIIAGGNHQCNQVAITGIKNGGTIVALKANVFYYRYYDGLRQSSPSQSLSSDTTKCDSSNQIQPFAPPAKGLSELIIFRNASIQIDNQVTSLQCSANSNLFTFTFPDTSSYVMSITSIPIEKGCTPLNWIGDSCSSVTTPPVIPLIQLKNITNQWTSQGVVYYQYKIVIVNPNTFDAHNVQLVVQQGEFKPLQYWNFEFVNDTTLKLPSYVNPLKAGQSYELGYVVINKDFIFSIVYTK